jgi:hypothetical protein
MLAAVYYPGVGLPARKQDLMKAGANIGQSHHLYSHHV